MDKLAECVHAAPHRAGCRLGHGCAYRTCHGRRVAACRMAGHSLALPKCLPGSPCMREGAHPAPAPPLSPPCHGPPYRATLPSSFSTSTPFFRQRVASAMRMCSARCTSTAARSPAQGGGSTAQYRQHLQCRLQCQRADTCGEASRTGAAKRLPAGSASVQHTTQPATREAPQRTQRSKAQRMQPGRSLLNVRPSLLRVARPPPSPPGAPRPPPLLLSQP